MADVFGNIQLYFQKTFKKFKVAIVFKGIKMEKLQILLNLTINYFILNIILLNFKLGNNLKILKAKIKQN